MRKLIQLNHPTCLGSLQRSVRMIIKRTHNNFIHRILIYKGASMRMSEWARELEISSSTLQKRVILMKDMNRIFTKGSLRSV